MRAKWQNLFLVLTFLGSNRAQQLSSFGRRAGGLPVGLDSSFGSRFRLSSGSGLRLAPSGAWLSSPPTFGSSGSQLSGSTVPRRISSQGNRLVLGRASSNLDNNNNALSLQLPQQTSLSQQTIHTIQPQQVHQVHAAHQPQQAVVSQTRQVLSQPRQALSQSRQVLSQPQPLLQQTQHVQPQPQLTQTVQQIQPVARVQQSLQQQQQVVQTAPAAIQTPLTGSHVTAQQSVIPGLVPQSIGVGIPAASAAAGIGSPLGMGSPIGMAGAMNPMAAMMGMGPMGMGMGMGMGMPFMSYDTMEDLLFDGPDRRPVPAGAAAMAAAAAASTATAGAGIGAGIARPAQASVPAASAPVAGQPASAASVGLGHLTGLVGAPAGAAAPVAAAGTQGRVSAAQVDPAVIQSALQTALSRVQQRQSPQTQLVG